MGNRDSKRTTRRRSEWWRYKRAEKRTLRAKYYGYRLPPDRHYGRFGWLETYPFLGPPGQVLRLSGALEN